MVRTEHIKTSKRPAQVKPISQRIFQKGRKMKIAAKTVWQVALILVMSILLSSCTVLSPKPDPEEEETQETTEDVEDETEISKESTEPEIVFEQEEAAINDYMNALKASDFDLLSELSGDVYSEESFTQEKWQISKTLFAASYEDMTWTIGEKEMVSDSVMQVKVNFVHGDFAAAVYRLLHDKEALVDVNKPIVLYNAEKMEHEVAYLEYQDGIEKYMLGRIEDSSKPMNEESYFQLEYDKNEDAWIVTKIPEVFFFFSDYNNYDPMFLLTDAELVRFWTSSTQELLNDGEINKASYDVLVSLFYGFLDEETAAVETSIVMDALAENGWYDAASDQKVTEYPVGTEVIYYKLGFNKDISGHVLKFDVYVDDEKEASFSGAIDMLDSFGLNIPLDCEGVWKESKVHMIVYLLDQTVIVDDYVEVK
jgi:NACalpha-BTF3-like transcription factor